MLKKLIASLILSGLVLGAVSVRADELDDEIRYIKTNLTLGAQRKDHDAEFSSRHWKDMAQHHSSMSKLGDGRWSDQEQIARGYSQLTYIPAHDVDLQAKWLAAIRFAQRHQVGPLYDLLDPSRFKVQAVKPTPQVQPLSAHSAGSPASQVQHLLPLVSADTVRSVMPVTVSLTTFDVDAALQDLAISKPSYSSEKEQWQKRRGLAQFFYFDARIRNLAVSAGNIDSFMASQISAPDYGPEERAYLVATFRQVADYFRGFQATGAHLDEIALFELVFPEIKAGEQGSRARLLRGFSYLSPLPPTIQLEDLCLTAGAPAPTSTASYPGFASDEAIRSQKFRFRGNKVRFDIFDGPFSGRANGCGFDALGIETPQFIRWFNQNNTRDVRRSLTNFVVDAIITGTGHLEEFCKAKGYTYGEIQHKLFQGDRRDWKREALIRGLFLEQGESILTEFFRWYVKDATNMLSPSEVINFGAALGKKVRVHYYTVSPEVDVSADINILMIPGHFQRMLLPQ